MLNIFSFVKKKIMKKMHLVTFTSSCEGYVIKGATPSSLQCTSIDYTLFQMGLH